MRNKKYISSMLYAVAVSGGLLIYDVQASSISPSELLIDYPTQVLMVDGKDRDTNVTIRFRLDLPKRSAFDFGFMRDGSFIPITGTSRNKGDYTFTGGSLVDFALRGMGGDGLFGTADDLFYRLSDSAGYASQHYFTAVAPSRSRLPMVTHPYYKNLSLDWDLNLDGLVDTHVLLKISGGKYDGMMPAPMAVALPGASWLLGSGLVVLGVTARRRKGPSKS